MDKLNTLTRYRHRFEKKAESLLKKLIPPACHPEERFLRRGISMVDILVIGAGSFPSFIPLVNALLCETPSLSDIHFTLVEPIKTETDFFLNHFASSKEKNVTIDFTVYHGDLKQYLIHADNKKFDILYFEHPETMTLPILLAKLGLSRFKRITSLRESIPYLGNVLKENTLILATCMSTHELKQLNSLLQFSLEADATCVSSRRPWDRFYGGPYCAGLMSIIKKPILSPLLQKKRSIAIRHSDRYLFETLLVSLFVYIFYCSQYPDAAHAGQRLLAILLMGSQLYLHRPGHRGYLIKITLLILQTAL